MTLGRREFLSLTVGAVEIARGPIAKHEKAKT